MGMFDYIRCRQPLSGHVTDRVWQTKDTPGFPRLDLYEIRRDGSLWHQSYDCEDRSDPNAEGLMRVAGMLTRINKRWGRVRFTGEIRFYGAKHEDGSNNGWGRGWLEYSAYFVDGQIRELSCVEDRDDEPEADDAVGQRSDSPI